MDLALAEKHIRRAWIAAVISGSITLLFSILAALNPEVFLPHGIDAWSAGDAALVFGLAFGIYRKSRVCAVILATYFLVSKVMFFYTQGSASHLAGLLVFGYFFFHGVRGTFAYHDLKPKETLPPENVPRRKRLWLFVVSATILGVLALCVLIVIGSLGPATQVYPGALIPKRFMTTIRGLNLLEEREPISFFYSDALIDIREGFYFFSDRKVVVYARSLEAPAVVVPFEQITEIEVTFSDSWLDDSQITLHLVDGNAVWFPVSTENGGDKLFFDALRKAWEPFRPEPEDPTEISHQNF